MKACLGVLNLSDAHQIVRGYTTIPMVYGGLCIWKFHGGTATFFSILRSRKGRTNLPWFCLRLAQTAKRHREPNSSVTNAFFYSTAAHWRLKWNDRCTTIPQANNTMHLPTHTILHCRSTQQTTQTTAYQEQNRSKTTSKNAPSYNTSTHAYQTPLKNGQATNGYNCNTRSLAKTEQSIPLSLSYFLFT
jgi:hypothetical protein